jgi:hypothetical protein
VCVYIHTYYCYVCASCLLCMCPQVNVSDRFLEILSGGKCCGSIPLLYPYLLLILVPSLLLTPPPSLQHSLCLGPYVQAPATANQHHEHLCVPGRLGLAFQSSSWVPGSAPAGSRYSTTRLRYSTSRLRYSSRTSRSSLLYI